MMSPLPDRIALAELAVAEGAPVPCAGNLPVDLGDPGSVWFIEKGTVDLFMIESQDGAERAAPQHMLRAESGRLLPGLTPEEEAATALSVVARGLPGTILRRLPVSSLDRVPNDELAANVDVWLADLSAVLSRDVEYRPRFDALIEAGQTAVKCRGTLSSRRKVVWVLDLPRGTSLFLGLVDPADGGRALPLTEASWLDLMEELPLSACSSRELARQGRLLSRVREFHSIAFALERLNRSLTVVDQANLERARTLNRRSDEDSARRRLFNLYGLLKRDARAAATSAALRDVLRLIGRHEGIRFKWPVKADGADRDAFLRELMDGSGVRGRRVRLHPGDKWWIGDSGAMLAFKVDGEQPVALLPGVLGRYREVDPAAGTRIRMGAGRAASLGKQAWMFYKPLERSAATAQDILGMIKRGLAINLARYLAVGLLGGLIMLVPALVIGFVADEIIPAGETGLLYAAVAGLAAAALMGALLRILQGMALMRIEGRAASRVEAAFWDRLLRLPPDFLRRYPAGDLAVRGMTFQSLRDTVQGVVANAVLSVVFLSPAILVIFLHNALLGAVAALFGLVSLILTIVLGLRQMKPRAAVIRAVQSLVGRLFQLIKGISKLRVDGAEGSAYAVWARDYRKQKRAESQLGVVEEHLKALGETLPLLAAAVLFLAVSVSGSGKIPVGDFLVIYTLFILCQSAIVRLGGAFHAIAAIRPAVQQIEPFLAEAPESSAKGEAVERLGGEVVFDRVSFRYSPDGPLVVDDVSIRVRPGEFVAIAGESGAGKSTLFRLALGLDSPNSGAVYFDGRDLKGLNIKQLRRQIGAVPQQVTLHPEDVWDNIAGDYDDVTTEDAWAAAEAAAVHREIAAMPMGMMTCVGAGVGVLSGGESQRIVIARAFLRNPRILLLDEATNWLDNESQAIVMRNLAQLTSTRIIIAHRLSTLREADRILVMQGGRLVQQGSFADLTEVNGPFRNLVRRQIA